MAKTLRITLFGSPEITLRSEPVRGFVSIKAQALVWYLAATSGTHTRDALAGLLWSDIPDSNARRNLRDVLSNLRGLIGDYLLITRQTVGINQKSPHFVDSVKFSSSLAECRLEQLTDRTDDLEKLNALTEAVNLFRDQFLAGFYVSEAPIFEEWCQGQREHLNRELEQALELLVNFIYSLFYDI